MPIFNKEITFIHIPKTGGTSIEKFLSSNGHSVSMLNEKIDFIQINGHSPQHCTYLELKDLGLLTEKIFTVVRPEVERTVSEFFYIKKYRPDLSSLFNTFNEFLDVFLDQNNRSLFDFHNLSNRNFLKNEKDEIDHSIEIFNYFDSSSIEKYLGISGISKYQLLKTQKGNFTLKKYQSQRIKKFFDNDN